MAQEVGLINWTPLGKVRIKKMFGKVDPTAEMQIMVRNFLKEERKKHNQTVASAFEINEGEFAKYEFEWLSPAYKLPDSGDENLLGMKITTNIIYAKIQSLLFFSTDYEVQIKKGCSSSKYGKVCVTGGKKYELEEIFYKKITSLQATHDEDQFVVVGEGCSGKDAVKTVVKDGFKIRAAENFAVYDNNPNELQACRKDINERIQKAQ